MTKSVLDGATETQWYHPADVPDGVDVILWRQDSHRQDNLYGTREVGSFDAETDEWYDSHGDAIGNIRAWTHLPERPTVEQLAGLSPRSSGER